MASPEIKADYEILDQIKTLFSRRSDRWEQIVRQLESQAQNLCTEGWIGVGSVAFDNEMQGSFLPRMKRLVEALGAASSTTASTSSVVETAEDAAAKCFENVQIEMKA